MTKHTVKDTCLKMIKEGDDIGKVISFLKESKFSIIESMKIIREIYGISLAESKFQVVSHPSWKKIVAGHQKLHDELEDLITKASEKGDGAS